MQGVGKLFLELHTHKYRHRKKGANIGWNINMNGLCVRIFIHFMEFCRTQRHERWWLRMMMMHTQSIFRKTRLKKFIELSFVACCSLQISVCAFLCIAWKINGASAFFVGCQDWELFFKGYWQNIIPTSTLKTQIRPNHDKKRKKSQNSTKTPLTSASYTAMMT